MPSRLPLLLAFGLALSAGFALDPAMPVTAAPSGSALTPSPEALPPGNPVVARIDGTELHLSDVLAARQTLPEQAQKLPLRQIYPVLLDRLVNARLIVAAGRKDHLDQDPEVQRRLRRDEDRLIAEAYVERAIKNGETPQRLEARYRAYLEEKPAQEQVHARHILVKTEAEAKSIIAELGKGADFAALAKKYSTDPAASSGGDLGWFGRNDMVPAFAAAAFALKPGQYTKTPVKTEFGWHVIEVEDRRVQKPPSLADAHDEVSQLLARDILAAKLRELRSAAKVETYGLDGKPLPASK